MNSQPYPRSPKALLGGIAHLGRSRKTLVGHAQWETPHCLPSRGKVEERCSFGACSKGQIWPHL